MLRGVDFEIGGLIKKVKLFLLFLILFFILVFKRVDEFVIVMEVCCYRGLEGCIKFKKFEFGLVDYILFVVCGILIIFVIVVR